MAEQTSALGRFEAYRDLIIDGAPPHDQIMPQTDTRIDRDSVRIAFNRAAAGEDAISARLIHTLTQRPFFARLTDAVELYRSNPYARPEYSREELAELILDSYDPAFEALGEILLEPFKDGREFSPEESREIRRILRDMEKQSGIENEVLAAFFGYAIRDVKESFRPPELYSYIDNDQNRPLMSKIEGLLRKEVSQGSLTDGDQHDLNQALQEFREAENLSGSFLNEFVLQFKNEVVREPQIMAGALKEAFDKIEFDALPIIQGAYFPDKFIAVADYNSGIETALLSMFGFNPENLPRTIPDMTSEQLEFLIALHEAEHMSQDGWVRNLAAENGNMSDTKHSTEIDADLAILEFLLQEGRPDIADFWLRLRQVTSFTFGDFDHDTATPLRVFHETGQLVDLGKLFMEKVDLRRKVAHEIDTEGEPQIADWMRATANVLEKDAAQDNSLLSDVQRTESKSFIEDAAALGFVPAHARDPSKQQKTSHEQEKNPAELQTSAKNNLIPG